MDDKKPTPVESRRDRLAGNAMQALIVKWGHTNPTTRDADILAVSAYEYAAAMERARAKL